MWNKLGRQGALPVCYLFYYLVMCLIDAFRELLCMFVIVLGRVRQMQLSVKNNTILRSYGSAVNATAGSIV